jgi:hypothetical protein
MKTELITKEDLSLIGDNFLQEKQLAFILRNTPAQFVRTRPAKGGGTWKYVTTAYVRKCLNLMFGWDWDFEIVDTKTQDGEVIVLGKLTARAAGRTLVKMQYGNKEIAKKKDGSTLSIGNDMKAAASDALKKCAAEIGIAADIYGGDDFRPINVATNNSVDVEELKELLETATHLSDQDIAQVKDIIDNQRRSYYLAAYKLLTN